MHRISFPLLSFTCLLLPGLALAQTPAPGLRVPPGFVVTEYADQTLANDIYTMTIDPQGRLVVAGRGYIRILVDDNKDGRADRAIAFADTPKEGAMGMLWEGDTLYVTGDGGLRRFFDKNNDGKADGPSELIRKLKTGGEHTAHAIRRGPAGWLYVLCGNNAGIDRFYAQLPTSPIAKPVAGCVLRFTPDLQKSEIVAHGFRNPYGMDFNPDGELFTYDSDNERCVSLPWYEHCRFYHVIPGGFYGWLNPQHADWWRCPPYFLDVVAPVATLDRGSPTGVVCYRHTQFPDKYHGGFFALDWTFGKVYFLSSHKYGSTYRCQKEVFLTAAGDNGFAPTAAVAHPATGDLYISIGGRGTRGAVYRIQYQPKSAPASKTESTNGNNKSSSPLAPLAGRGVGGEGETTTSHSLDWQPKLHDILLSQATSVDLFQRRRALHLLHWHTEHFTSAALTKIIHANWNEPDRYICQATATLLQDLPEESQQKLVSGASEPGAKITCALARYQSKPKEVMATILPLLGRKEHPRLCLDAVRLTQLALGDIVSPKLRNVVWEGYASRQPLATIRQQLGKDTLDALLQKLQQTFPTNEKTLDRELARTLALLQDDSPVTLHRVARLLGRIADPVEQIHYLIVLARLPARRDDAITKEVADTLLGLDRKLDQQKSQRDTHWPRRIGELTAELIRRDARLPQAILDHEEFGRPDHVLLALAPGMDRKAAARTFLQRAAQDQNYAWTPQLVQFLEVLPVEQIRPLLDDLWQRGGLESALLPLLARQPEARDHDKFVSGLNSPDLGIVRSCLHALQQLPSRQDKTEILALLTTWNRLPPKEGEALEKAIAAHLQQITGQKFGPQRQHWLNWFSTAQPKLAERLHNRDGVDLSAWQKRLQKLDWNRGEAKQGQHIFSKASCIGCHSGGQALGPDLHGVTSRFSRDDLFTAIVQPSRDVPNRYQATLIETHDGKIYQGLIIYEAVDGILLQTGAATTVRIPGDQIASQRPTLTSLMPAGLLDNLTDRDIVDLYAYLRTLGK